MNPVTSNNPLDMVPLSSGMLLLAQAAAQGITGGVLYLMNNEAGIWRMVEQSEWGAAELPPLLYLFVAFGKQPSDSWGGYMAVGEIKFYLQQGSLTWPMIKQMLA